MPRSVDREAQPVPVAPRRLVLPRRTWAWAAAAGLLFGAFGSVLNHLSAAGPLAAVVGVGVGWFAAGVGAAALLLSRHPRARWTTRAVVVAIQYVLACTSYYLADWLYALPSLRRLQRDVLAGRVPDPGGISLAPDWQEWLFWSVAAVPAGMAATAVVGAGSWVLRRTRERDALPRA